MEIMISVLSDDPKARFQMDAGTISTRETELRSSILFSEQWIVAQEVGVTIIYYTFSNQLFVLQSSILLCPV